MFPSKALIAIGVISAVAVATAQRGGGARESAPVRHLVYIATPGDNGTDNQSGVVVLDADKDYSFLKRISYDLPASLMPGPKVSGITVSVPLQMLYVTTDGNMIAIDLTTDKIAWTFKGETGAGRADTRGAASGCCERPWTLPDGKTLLVGSSYNAWWYYIDGATGKVLGQTAGPRVAGRSQPGGDRGRPARVSSARCRARTTQGRPDRHRRAEPEGAALHDLLRDGASAHDQP